MWFYSIIWRPHPLWLQRTSPTRPAFFDFPNSENFPKFFWEFSQKIWESFPKFGKIHKWGSKKILEQNSFLDFSASLVLIMIRARANFQLQTLTPPRTFGLVEVNPLTLGQETCLGNVARSWKFQNDYMWNYFFIVTRRCYWNLATHSAPNTSKP